MREIVLAGPAKNALGTELMQSVRSQLDAAGGEPVLLTGQGDSFSAGLNLKELLTLDAEGMESFLDGLGSLLHALFHYPGPTVAWVNGHAIAGGCLLALCCDVRVAADDPRARIGLNEVALGLRFPPGILRLVNHRVPVPHNEAVLLGAQLYDPAGALAVGLVDAVSGDQGVAAQRLQALAALPPEAYAATKRALRGEVEVRASRAFLAEVLPAWTSPDLKARIQAFLGR